MKRLFFLIILTSSLIVPALAQEVCNNGFDDDNDGFVDCFDKDCVETSICLDSYIGNDAKCQVTPSAFPKFTMTKDWESPNEVVNHLNRISIGDLDGDGAPEVVSVNVVTNKIFILNGVGGTIKKSISVAYSLERDPLIGNVNGSSCATIFTYGSNFSGGKTHWKIYAYDCNLNLLWSSPNDLVSNPYYLSLADFDGDGNAELYYKDEIIDATNGTRLVKSKNFKYMAAPIAVDMLGDKRLELVCGGLIYDVNLGARTADAGTLTLLAQEPHYRIRQEENSTTSVADYNLDGFPDVLATGSRDGSASTDITKNTNQNTTIFFWDVHNFPSGPATTYIDAFNTIVRVYDCKNGNPVATDSGAYYANGWRNGAGRINIADTDGDGKLNAVYVSGKFLYILNENLTLNKRIVVNEETSGYTGCTMFDFNGDGKSEIVYRDEKYVYIIYGDGTISNQQPCVSRTNREYPIVADVDADGSTEICVTCASDDNLSASDFCNQGTIGNQRYSVVRAFKSASDPWVPARRLWNQHGYFNVNVNDNLTIPRQQQKHWLVFSSGSCTQGANYPLNKFLNQSPFLNSDGCPQYAAPDISYVDNSLIINNPTCPDKDFTVSLKIENKGDLSVSSDMPVTFYKGDPRLPGATKLNTAIIKLTTFKPNDVFAITNATVNGDGTSFKLFIVLNDAGTSIPTPISLPNTSIVECNYDNFIEADVQPKPVAVTAVPVADNIKCIGSTSANNGAVKAFVTMAGGVKNTADYNFYWSNGPTAKAKPADFTGATYTGLSQGTYTVYALHKTANCSSDTAQAVVGQIVKIVKDTITIDHIVDNCKTPNGQLSASIEGGDPVSNYTFDWYLGSNIFGVKFGVGSVVSGLSPGTYTALATDKATGCSGVFTASLDPISANLAVTPAAVDILCSAASNSGSVSATATGTSNIVRFSWYKGSTVKPAANFFTYSTAPASHGGLTAGNYTVVAFDSVTQCSSSPATITLKQTTDPVVNATVTSDQTSCDSSLPNGSAQADIGGTTTGYSFEWFKGQNTLAANSVATTSTATGLAPSIYTVQATDNVTGCSATKEVTVNFAVVTPVLTLAAVGNMTNCTTPNGSVSVNVSIDTPADYTFFWYNGTTVKASPDYPETSNTLTGLPVGPYTVRAVHNTKHCAAEPITASVKDATPVINIILDASVTQLPSDCTSPDGVMNVSVSAAGNTSGFNIKWYFGNAPFSAPPVHEDNAVTSSTASSLLTGVYTVVATNLDNGCVASKAFNLPFANAQRLDFVSKVDVDKCSPTNIGSITVKLTKTPLAGFTEGDYDIFVYAGTNEAGTPIETIHGVTGTLQYVTSGTLIPGPYTLVAVSNNVLTPGCKSVPIDTAIIRIKKDPVIGVAAVNANTNCSGITANGNISLSISAPTTDPNDYDFNWFSGTNVTGAPLTASMTGGVNGEVAQNLPPGFYTVHITKKLGTGANSGCDTTATYQIFDNPPIISIASTDISTTDVTLCTVPNGGSATVAFVKENGTQVSVAGYTFAWYNSSQTQIGTSPSKAGLAAGTYYVVATSTANNCASTKLEFEIKDKTINTVGVDLVSFTDPTRCLKPANITGELNVQGTGNSTTGYSYAWYASNTTTPPSVWATADFTGITIPGSATSVTYTVEVTNNSNGCTATDTYVLPLDIIPVTITASAAPLTSCSFPNGSTFSFVTSGSNNEYNYDWSFGNAPKAAPDSVKKEMTALPAGNYTIVAVDQLDNTCVTSPLTVTVDNAQVFPIVTAKPDNPMTTCDPSKANGIASASVDEDIIGYSFDWYIGNKASGMPFYTGDQASNLDAVTYAVVATDITSGCRDTTTVAIVKKPITIPVPLVTVISDVTNCDPDNPNGSLSVAPAQGNPSEYKFTWTKDADASFGTENGPIIDSIAAGDYTVQAMEIASGCTASAPGKIRINQVLPDIGLAIVNASCNVFNENGVSTGQPDGSVALFMKNDVNIESVIWTDYDTKVVLSTGPILSGIDRGKYEVTVITAEQCRSSATAEVNTDVHPFNGISRNGDGRNETFWINCIDNFPQNIVKIYNRAGTLVYEATNYNNSDTVFDGRSNRGVSPMGTNLPDGTYFYIIDKRDGSKQLAGYLEIVN